MTGMTAMKSSESNKFQVCARHRRACPGGAMTDQLLEPLAALSAPVGLVPTERMTVSLEVVAPVGASPTESQRSARDVIGSSPVIAPPGQARRWPYLELVRDM
jgi:hypothetical protein